MSSCKVYVSRVTAAVEVGMQYQYKLEFFFFLSFSVSSQCAGSEVKPLT
jgi:hypothetical protein